MAESKANAELQDLVNQLRTLKQERPVPDAETFGSKTGLTTVGKVGAGPATRLDTIGKAPRRVLKGHFGKVYALHWAGAGPTQGHVVSASQDGKLIVWDTISTNKVHAIPLRSSWVMTCAFEPTNNRLLASGGLDNLCSVYKISEDGKADTRAAKELAGHDGCVVCAGVGSVCVWV